MSACLAPDNLDKIYQGKFSSVTEAAGSLNLLNWNIERGLQFSGIVGAIERERPDICILQEVDLNAQRTDRRNVADELARRFQLNYVFGWNSGNWGRRHGTSQPTTGRHCSRPFRSIRLVFCASSINRVSGNQPGICPTGPRSSADSAGAWLWCRKSAWGKHLWSFTTSTWRAGEMKVYASCNWKRCWWTPNDMDRKSL
jgi:hypothetical protein